MVNESVDVAIIGAGPGGYSTALRAAELGKRVALIERDSTLGGTCLNRGCIPSKALITATRSIQTVRFARQLGVNASVDDIDFSVLRGYRRRIVDTMVKGLTGLVAARGITVYHGAASLEPDHTVHVVPSPGLDHVEIVTQAQTPRPVSRDESIAAHDVVIATGSTPRQIPGAPFSGGLIDSTQALAMDQFPARAVIVGAGAVAVEFASMWNAAGCKVTLLIRKDSVLSHGDRRSAVTVTRELKRQGVAIIDHAHVTGVETGVNLGATVHYTREDDGAQDPGGERTVYGEVVLAAVGRSPLTGDGWFDAAGIRKTASGLVQVDAWGRTNVDGVWALGDITPGPALAHRAFEQGITIAETIAGLDPPAVDMDTIPHVIFSTPEVASVGMTIDAAQADGAISNVRETVYPMLANSRVLMEGSTGSMSIISGERADDPGTQTVVGVHIVSEHASELIAEAEQIVGNRIPLSKAARLIHPHPTFSEAFGEALLKADGRPLHTR
jgi:dihydrolipoamide dehydrogenase